MIAKKSDARQILQDGAQPCAHQTNAFALCGGAYTKGRVPAVQRMPGAVVLKSLDIV